MNITGLLKPCVSVLNNKLFLIALISDDTEKLKDFMKDVDVNERNTIMNGKCIFPEITFENNWFPNLPWNIAIMYGSHNIMAEMKKNSLDYHQIDSRGFNAIHILIMTAYNEYRSEDSCCETFDIIVSLLDWKEVGKYLLDNNEDQVNCMQLACQLQTLQLMMKIFEFEGVYKFMDNVKINSLLSITYYDVTDLVEIKSPCEIVSPLDCIHSIIKEKMKEANTLVQKDPLKTWIKATTEERKPFIRLCLFVRCMRFVLMFITLLLLYPSDIQLTYPKLKIFISSLTLSVSFFGLVKTIFTAGWRKAIVKKHSQFVRFYLICDLVMYSCLMIFTVFHIAYYYYNIKFSVEVYQILVCGAGITSPWHIFNFLRSKDHVGSFRYIYAIQRMMVIACRFMIILVIIYLPFVVCFTFTFHEKPTAFNTIETMSDISHLYKEHLQVDGVMEFISDGNNLSIINITDSKINFDKQSILINGIKMNTGRLMIEKKHKKKKDHFGSWFQSMYHTWILMLGVADIMAYEIEDKTVVAYFLHFFYTLTMSLMVLEFLTALFVQANTEINDNRFIIAAMQSLDVLRSSKDFVLKRYFLKLLQEKSKKMDSHFQWLTCCQRKFRKTCSYEVRPRLFFIMKHVINDNFDFIDESDA